MNSIIVKYFDDKSLFTIDLEHLIKVIINHRDIKNFSFSKMSEDEKIKYSSIEEHGIINIKNRIIIFDQNMNRLKNIEEEIISLGRK